jgi:F-box protein 9
VHLVTYYRYLRFFPDGRVLNFISNDEPIQVVHLMVPSFTRRQFFRGNFDWDGNDKVVVRMTEDGRTSEHFEIRLLIKHPNAHRKRRSYKLAWESYTSRKVEGDDGGPVNAYNIRLMKPFVFSAVTSYRVDFTKQKDSGVRACV